MCDMSLQEISLFLSLFKNLLKLKNCFSDYGIWCWQGTIWFPTQDGVSRIETFSLSTCSCSLLGTTKEWISTGSQLGKASNRKTVACWQLHITSSVYTRLRSNLQCLILKIKSWAFCSGVGIALQLLYLASVQYTGITKWWWCSSAAWFSSC